MIPVLDHGYIKLVEFWGSDERIIEAARMSTDKGFQGWGYYRWECSGCQYSSSGDGAEATRPATCPNCKTLCSLKESYPGDEKLLRFLYTHKHFTPFEMAGAILEIQAPIFVFREWHRHRTQSYNELSARYTPLPDVNYIPSRERLLMSGGTNKQAQGTGELLTEEMAENFRQNLAYHYHVSDSNYRNALDVGVPKELARLVIPVGRYSRMRASANLRNWLHFLTLRMDPAAQWEIRQYANVVGQIISQKFPRTWELFMAGKSSE